MSRRPRAPVTVRVPSHDSMFGHLPLWPLQEHHNLSKAIRHVPLFNGLGATRVLEIAYEVLMHENDPPPPLKD